MTDSERDRLDDLKARLDLPGMKQVSVQEVRDALAAGLDRDTRSRYQLIDRLNALERALRQTKARLERGWTDAAMRELDAAFTDQPNRERAAQIAEDIGDAETAAEVRGREDQIVASHSGADPSHNAACVSQDAGGQAAQDGDGIKIVDTGHGYVVRVHGETYEVHRTLHDAKEGWNRAAMAYPNAPRHIGIYREMPADQPADAGEPEAKDKQRS
jgi:hypothetical protein